MSNRVSHSQFLAASAYLALSFRRTISSFTHASLGNGIAMAASSCGARRKKGPALSFESRAGAPRAIVPHYPAAGAGADLASAERTLARSREGRHGLVI